LAKWSAVSIAISNKPTLSVPVDHAGILANRLALGPHATDKLVRYLNLKNLKKYKNIYYLGSKLILFFNLIILPGTPPFHIPLRPGTCPRR
jgi:hypothetical protein